MTDIYDLEVRFHAELETVKKHLSSKASNSGRTQLGPKKIQHLYDNNADCPICGTIFEGGNHNTEHIFPIAFGGKNTMQNKIQICVMCNNSRNQVMQAMIGNSPRSEFPSNWVKIKQIILWLLITIDDGIQAGKLLQTPHNKFMQYRTGGEPFPNRPKRAYGRFSTWKIGDEPNYKMKTNFMQKQRSKSPFLRIFEKFFLYDNKQKAAKTQETVSENVTSRGRITSNTTTTNQIEPDPQSLRKSILSLISEDEQISVMAIGNRIRKFQESNGWDEVGTRSYLESHGFPRNFGLLNALKQCFGEQILVTNNQSEQQVKISNNIQPNYPQTKYLNSGHEGLQLPREPEEFANVLSWLSKNIHQYETHTDCRDALKDTKLTSSNRSTSVLLLLYSVIIDDYDKLQDEFKAMPPIDCCDKIIEYFFVHDVTRLRAETKPPEIKEEIVNYMESAKIILSKE